jgi:sec-independent protein translocase protein TatA
MPPNIGGTELVIALVIILLLFGAKRIPELARGLGSGMREFRKGTSGEYEKVLGIEPAGEPADGASDEAKKAGAGRAS